MPQDKEVKTALEYFYDASSGHHFQDSRELNFLRENYAKMHRDVVRGPPPRVTSGNYCARNTIIAEPTPRYTTITTSDGRTRKSVPRNTVLAEPTPRVDKWNRGTMPEMSGRLVDIVRKDEVVPTKFVGNQVVPSPTTATVAESGQVKWSGNYQTTSLAQNIHASSAVLNGTSLLEQLRPPPEPTYQRTYFQPQTSIARYRPEELEQAVKATQKRKPRTETKAGIPPGAAFMKSLRTSQARLERRLQQVERFGVPDSQLRD